MRKTEGKFEKKRRKTLIEVKKMQKNIIGNQSICKKVHEKSKKKFGRIKKVRTFALANEVRGYSLKEIARVHWNNRNLR